MRYPRLVYLTMSLQYGQKVFATLFLVFLIFFLGTTFLRMGSVQERPAISPNATSSSV